jgi:hypothetical protein
LNVAIEQHGNLSEMHEASVATSTELRELLVKPSNSRGFIGASFSLFTVSALIASGHIYRDKCISNADPMLATKGTLQLITTLKVILLNFLEQTSRRKRMVKTIITLR